jgi:tRNA(fMet)-specific endonuclease VapC
MDARYLLDTNICVYIRQRRPEHVFWRFQEVRRGEAQISVITYGELLYGAAKSANRKLALERIRELTNVLDIKALPEAAAELYGSLRIDLETKGQMIGNNDLWIAAHALAAGLTLVTNNEREFRRVRSLKVENWAV